jgi:hypothetical protein
MPHALNNKDVRLEQEPTAGARRSTPLSPSGMCDNEMQVNHELFRVHKASAERDISEVDAATRDKDVQ